MTNAVAIAQQGSNNTTFRNRIINGAMVIDQRNAGASYTASDGAYSLDRWKMNDSVNSKFTVIQSSTAPAGFNNSALITSSAATSVGATDYYFIRQNIEGFNTGDLAWGTASAKTVTLSFWVQSSLTGTFGGAIQNSAQNRAYPFSYTISSANTWTYVTVTIPGDTTGTWVGATNGIGITVLFSLGMGSNYSAPANAWTSGFSASVTGAVNVVSTNGATWYLTGVQFEAGSTASPFENRSYGTEFALCQRYYQKSYDYSTVPGSSIANVNDGQMFQIFWATSAGSSVAGGTIGLRTTMRATPTLTIYDSVGNSAKITGSVANGTLTNNVNANVGAANTNQVVIRLYSQAYYGLLSAWTAESEL